MQKFKSSDSFGQLGALNYSAATFSFLIVLTLALFIHLVCEGISLYVTYNELRSSVLLKSSDVEIQELIERMSKMRSSTVSNFVMASVDSDEGESHLLTSSVRMVLNNLIARNYTEAANDFAKTEKIFRLPLIRILGGDQAAAAKLESVRVSIGELLVQKEQLSSLEQEVLKIEESLKTSQSQFSLVSAELSELLSLPGETDQLHTESLPIYKSGVLSGLPRLAKLEDGVASLPELREILARNGGVVKLSGSNVHEQFSAKIAAMRLTTEGIYETHERVLAELDQASSVVMSQSNRLRDSTSQTKMALTRIIVGGLEPKIGLLANQLYQALAQITAKVELLPRLPRIDVQPT